MRRLGLELVIAGLIIAMGGVAWDLTVVAAEAADHGHGGSHDEPIPHSLAATGVVVAGVGLAALGSFLFLRERAVRSGATLLLAAAALLFADGVVHLYAVSEHLAIVPYAAFFVVAGAGQLVLGFGVLRQSQLVYTLSALAMVGLIALYVATRYVATPFADHPEAFEALGLVSKALEVAALAPLGLLVYRQRSGAASPSGPSAAP